MKIWLIEIRIVLDRTRPAGRSAAIVVGTSKRPGQLRICRWRGGQQHWSLPVTVDRKQLERIVDWTLMPLTEAKRLASAAFERNYLVHAMESAKGSMVDAARLAGVDRSNFRRLLQRHGLVRIPPRPKRRRRTQAPKPSPRPKPPREVLYKEANARFWRDTRYKPGQNLDMADVQDRKMAKVWMDIFRQVQREANKGRLSFTSPKLAPRRSK